MRAKLFRGVFLSVISGVLMSGAANAQPAATKPAAPPAVKPAPVVVAPPRVFPAVALEAEDFKIDGGWKVMEYGKGNYMWDAVGFCHVSGERLLSLPSSESKGEASIEFDVPEAGPYRLWVRYEYCSFTEARFKAVVEQGGKQLGEKVMGAKDSPRYMYGVKTPSAQPDMPYGSEGLADESIDVTLAAGKARIRLIGVEQPQEPGVAANRNVDFVFLTTDVEDVWRVGGKGRELYPILNAFRDARGPRYEVRFTNKGQKPMAFSANHTYNRVPWGWGEGILVKDVAPGASSEWIGLKKQDTAHSGRVMFAATPADAFEVEIRPVGPVGGQVERKLETADASIGVFLPAYPGKGEKIVSPVEELDAILKLLAESPAPGRKPTLPLCQGGWLPLHAANVLADRYAKLYIELGLRSFATIAVTPPALERLKALGLTPNKSFSAPVRATFVEASLNKAKDDATKAGTYENLRYFDYGDEVPFYPWVANTGNALFAAGKAAKPDLKPAEAFHGPWRAWLKEKRPDMKIEEYWMPEWGTPDGALLKPDSSTAASIAKPKLYVDSVLFYEEVTVANMANHNKKLREVLGADVLGGANYSCHPFYYPSIAMYIKWFRGGAAELGRHSDYFWETGQLGPMINGFVAENFRAGMRFNPRALLRQYTQPHSPGNTQGSFLRSAFTHLAHGAKEIDFFAICMNEGWSENYVDHRDHQRYKDIRDVTYSVGLIEDVLPTSNVVASPVGVLFSDSTERWDRAGMIRDMLIYTDFDPAYHTLRLNYHLERVGLWKALTFAGSSPDLLVEDDLNSALLGGYKVLFVVGDSIDPAKVPALEAWVKSGGVLVATASAGRYGMYKDANPAFLKLLGIELSRVEEKAVFLRPRLELPFQKPITMVTGDATGGKEMAVISIDQRIKLVDGGKTLATFKNDSAPAVVVREVGQGKVYYVASLPGLAYLWAATQPPMVADRATNVHVVPTKFDAGADALLRSVLTAAGVDPLVSSDGGLIDTRLIQGKNAYVLPLANYNEAVGKDVTLSIKLPAAPKVATSSYQGKLTGKYENGRFIVTVPKLGFGDVLRLDM